ncbi:MAG TPA: FtsX-like permease family protein [Vicinamibacterales bacterium]|nr:FtsX-like permease family protein [Vicinamibacterales bacterium]
MRTLTRKLGRDLWRTRSQGLAVALVIGTGVAAHVLLFSTFTSLQLTEDRYYERSRFGQVFASLVRAPLAVTADVAAIPGVTAFDARVVVDVTLDVPGRTAPVSGRLISVPESGAIPVNDLTLTSGRLLNPGRDDEALAATRFATANHLEPGDTIEALINGRLRTLRLVGLVQSPEYIYAIRPGELIAADAEFGILWMNRKALATAFQMQGAFNDLALRIAPGASSADVIGRLDRLLEPYGGLGAIDRSQQLSHFFLQGEIDSLRGMGQTVPVVFLAVAAFLLNVVLTRLVAVEREQIAALKALGYRGREIGWHYVQWALAVAMSGALVGVVVGAGLGRALTRFYTEFFNFPILVYRLPPAVVIEGLGVAVLAAVVGAVGAVRRVVALPAAEAMRPEPPARYRVSAVERTGLGRRLAPWTRMVLRHLQRRPGRAALSIVAVAFSGALLIAGLFSLDSIHAITDIEFYDAERYDVMVTFRQPLSAAAADEMARLPGVRMTEPFRTVAARLTSGTRTRPVAIMGLPASGTLSRVIDGWQTFDDLPPGGLVLSRKLADLVGVAPGERVHVDVLEGRRPSRDVVVARVVDDYLGTNAYMRADVLHQLMQEGGTVSGAYLRVDPIASDALYRRLRATPAVAGVAVKQATIDNFTNTLAASVGITRTTTVLFAAIIAFGVVYNTVRVALSERGRELATLRVIGFTKGEIARVLFGEWIVLTIVALPLGVAIGYGLAALVVQAFNTDVYRLPFIVSARTCAWSILTVVAAAAVSGLVVGRRLSALDLIAVLKTRE